MRREARARARAKDDASPEVQRVRGPEGAWARGTHGARVGRLRTDRLGRRVGTKEAARRRPRPGSSSPRPPCGRRPRRRPRRDPTTPSGCGGSSQAPTASLRPARGWRRVSGASIPETLAGLSGFRDFSNGAPLAGRASGRASPRQWGGRSASSPGAERSILRPRVCKLRTVDSKLLGNPLESGNSSSHN